MTTYTLHTNHVSGDHVIARGLTAMDAMNHIIARADKLDYQVRVEGYEDFCRYWAIFRGGSGGETVLQASVPTTDSADADKSAAMDLIARQFRSIAHEYWDGRWDTDAAYDEMLRYPADRADADRMEREIAANFFDALADDGYVIARDSIGNEFKLDQAVDRAELLGHLNENWVGTSRSSRRAARSVSGSTSAATAGTSFRISAGRSAR